MSQRINFGIDLGTTNSAIARYHHQEVELIRNPSGLRQLLPSVIAFKGDRMIVGEKAREWLKRRPEQVFAAFKRKMGTTHQFRKPDGETISPEELSAMILSELKQFLPVEESPDAAVITIPASFDSVQSQATLRAGELAGFDEVRLLQEPIAASLAYANKAQDQELLQGKWLVYDLGGGTFDVALVSINDGEMKVMDHEGDNFLGGTDIDLQIVEKKVVPALEALGNFPTLRTDLRSGSGKYDGLLAKMLFLAEEAKIELSSMEETDIELEVEDEDGQEIELILTIKRSDLTEILEPFFERTLGLIRTMLTRNDLSPADLNTTLLVGGTTYIPYIREQLAGQLGIGINTEVDPTTAVAVGAAYYASTIELTEAAEPESEPSDDALAGLSAKFGYQKVTQDAEEFVIAELSEDQDVAFFRFIRQDGGFDTGMQTYSGTIRQYLGLLPNSRNVFTLRLYDQQQQELPARLPIVDITHGNFSLQGQPLPLDICLEVDDLELKSTRLEVIFPRNTLLPARKTVTRQVSRSINSASDDRLEIKVLEGEGNGIPEAALLIGNIRIGGKQLDRSLVKGSDVEITLEMNESRVLKVEAYLMMTDQEMKEVFSPEKREVDVLMLRSDLRRLLIRLRRELQETEKRDQFDLARMLTDLEYELMDLLDGAEALTQDDITDARYQIEDRLRKVAGELHRLTADQELLRTKEAYFHQKRTLEHSMEEYEASTDDQKAAQELMAEEKLVMASDSVRRIRLFTERVQNLGLQVKWKSPRYIRALYIQLKMTPPSGFTNPELAKTLFDQGDEALVQKNDHQLRVVLNKLFDLLPRDAVERGGFMGTGLS